MKKMQNDSGLRSPYKKDEGTDQELVTKKVFNKKINK